MVEKQRDELKSGLKRAELEKQLAEKSLKDAESNLENFRIQNITLPSEGVLSAPRSLM